MSVRQLRLYEVMCLYCMIADKTCCTLNHIVINLIVIILLIFRNLSEDGKFDVDRVSFSADWGGPADNLQATHCPHR